MIREVSVTSARRMAISRQHLAYPSGAATREGMLEVLETLRCLQLDPISTVARSHLLVLWSRLGNYDPRILEQLLWKERALFEYWAHCASIVLSQDLPIHQARMRRKKEATRAYEREIETWLAENRAVYDHVLERLAREGPLPSSAFEDKTQVDWASSGWTSGRNIPRLLDLLWDRGIVTVAGRRGQQRLWALSHDCFPDWKQQPSLSDHEVVRQAAQYSLRALGVGSLQQIKNHFIRHSYPNLKRVLDELQAEGVILPIRVAGQAKSFQNTWYIHRDDLALLEQIEAGNWQGRTTLLSPFDNLICDRDRSEQLFDFFFRIEIYVPQAKRQFGYYVLPILHHDRLIGRIDTAMDRKNQQLQIKAVYAEADAPLDQETGRAVQTAIEELATFLGAKSILIGEKQPSTWQLRSREGETARS
jgi:uncharacterized protein YcaQ